MASSEHKLTPLQEELLRAFFAREQGFFLSGGALWSVSISGIENRLDKNLRRLELQLPAAAATAGLALPESVTARRAALARPLRGRRPRRPGWSAAEKRHIQ